MIKPVEELLLVLEQQLGLYNQLLNLAKSKQPILVKGKIEDLDKVVKQEEVIIFQVGRLEEKRNAIQQALANHFALSAENMTAQELQKHIDQDGATRLRGIFEQLVKVISELEKINETNTGLIQNSLDFVNFYLNLLTSTDSTPSYDEQDKNSGNRSSRLFDHKI